MIEPISLAEKLLYSTARIVGYSATGEAKTGTAFFYNFTTTTQDVVPTLITNKHVIESTVKAEFLFHTFNGSEKAPSGRESILIQGGLENGWFGHPDPRVDLCALPLAEVQKRLSSLPFYVPLSGIPSDTALNNLDAIEEIVMIGYPNGLWDAANNYPLIRRGITASHPGIDFLIDGKGPAVTVVDMACFPGSSGSPVYIYNSGTYANKAGETHVGSRLIFLGVLFSGPVMLQDGSIVVKNIPTAAVPVAQTQLMIHLGYIIKPREVTTLGIHIFKKFGLPWPVSTQQA